MKAAALLVALAALPALLAVPAAGDVTIEAPPGSGALGCETEEGGCYAPLTATVDVGGTVTMSNTDTAAHTFTSGTPKGGTDGGTDGIFDSGLMQPGESYEWTPERAGTYDYFCLIHPWATGTIMVEAAGMADREALDGAADEMAAAMMDEMTGEPSGMTDREMLDEVTDELLEAVMAELVDLSSAPPPEGDPGAPITIIEFGDYQCPKCGQWHSDVKPVIESGYIEPGTASLYFVDYPFLGDDSDAASNAAHCAGDQGMYWEYHDALYSGQGDINGGWAGADGLKALAADLDLDAAEFGLCVDSEAHKSRVDYNRDVGGENGVDATPVFIIAHADGGTVRIEGTQPASVFVEAIDGLLAGPREAAAQGDEPSGEPGGGCLIATAAYGTELAPQVQLLREVRDGAVMGTASGAAFMAGFNSLYYSFSPAVADWERESPVFRDAVRALITPMVSTLSIMTLADSEAEVVGLGLSVIALNLGMYVAAPALAGLALFRRSRA